MRAFAPAPLTTAPPGELGSAGQATFRDEPGTYARGAGLQEGIFARAGRQPRAELVVLARDAPGTSAHAELRTLHLYMLMRRPA